MFEQFESTIKKKKKYQLNSTHTFSKLFQEKTSLATNKLISFYAQATGVDEEGNIRKSNTYLLQQSVVD